MEWVLAVGRINRNIVECKVRMRKNISKIKPVLIETQWNVKFDLPWERRTERQVLIETQWNVKFGF